MCRWARMRWIDGGRATHKGRNEEGEGLVLKQLGPGLWPEALTARGKRGTASQKSLSQVWNWERPMATPGRPATL